jgi:hypothetical protein
MIASISMPDPDEAIGFRNCSLDNKVNDLMDGEGWPPDPSPPGVSAGFQRFAQPVGVVAPLGDRPARGDPGRAHRANTRSDLLRPADAQGGSGMTDTKNHVEIARNRFEQNAPPLRSFARILLELQRFIWRRVAESNRSTRICNPLHNLPAHPPQTIFTT